MTILKTLALTAGAALLAGCSASIDDYRDTRPTFSLKNYFDGEITAWGIVQDYSGKLTRRFCVDIVATWQGNKGQLHESFFFNDGTRQTRIWKVNVAQDQTVTGTAGDVVGQASGSSQGSAFNWQYTLTVPIDGTEYDFAIDDWMYALDDQRMMNRSYMKKFGVTVAEFSIFFDKSARIPSCESQM
ncbi:putative lipoprotein [Paraglaciecola sp. T6c]|uniref:DUF3833 domain-containing protein n=1 Tax=Pseudoalteromonas atlantica (strain T6c / ATCC BAA-1087) TaxID=3042615 RepID=UPI00005C6EB6|nr:DUF3833 domain-containing protein [Paraglaciecola sp. T6c]ABG39850.1 putative lipoprotein [Paraglaciecola sp. T6c]